jgi:Ca-activated chloride channel family protein
MELPQDIPAFALLSALLVAALMAGGEWLHARRTRRLAALAFGPGGKARRAWTKAVPLARVLAAGAGAWALVTLLSFDDRTRARELGNNTDRHLVVLLDVSPSMLLRDAGEGGAFTRNARAAAVLKSVLDRLPGDGVRFTAIGFYTEARMLVKACRDRELLLHMATGTPFHITYKPGKTDVLGSVNQAGAMVKDFPRKSVTLLVLSDGDSLPPGGLQPLPSSVERVIIAGVGDTARGSFIDGHQSRQDTANLGQLARRLGGDFHDANLRHLPDEALDAITDDEAGASKWRVDRRMAALLLLGFSASVFALLPLLLDAFGSAWRHRPLATPSPVKS